MRTVVAERPLQDQFFLESPRRERFSKKIFAITAAVGGAIQCRESKNLEKLRHFAKLSWIGGYTDGPPSGDKTVDSAYSYSNALKS